MANNKSINKKWSDDEESGEESIRKSLTHSERRCKYCTKLLRKSALVESHELKCSKAISNTAEIFICEDGHKVFLCELCLKIFKYLTGLQRHKKRHEPPGGFICRYCDSRFCKEDDLVKHKEDTHQVFKCQLCSNIFQTGDEYLKHIDLVHDGRDREYWVCETCGQQFKSQIMLNIHTESKCGTEKAFKCSECGLKYMTHATLNAHKLIHKGEKLYCCSYCGKSFLSRGQLTVHERRHTGEKPYICEVCSKSFSHRESLVTHSSIHTGIKPYLCECCGARFSCVGNLQKHRRTRATTCGLPQYNKNAKAAPRPSTKIFGSLTMKSAKIIKASKVVMKPDEMKLISKSANIEDKIIEESPFEETAKQEDICATISECYSESLETPKNDISMKEDEILDIDVMKTKSQTPNEAETSTLTDYQLENYAIEFRNYVTDSRVKEDNINSNANVMESLNDGKTDATSEMISENCSNLNLQFQDNVIYTIIGKVDIENFECRTQADTLIDNSHIPDALNSTKINDYKSIEYFKDKILPNNDIIKQVCNEKEPCANINMQKRRKSNDFQSSKLVLFEIEPHSECDAEHLRSFFKSSVNENNILLKEKNIEQNIISIENNETENLIENNHSDNAESGCDDPNYSNEDDCSARNSDEPLYSDEDCCENQNEKKPQKKKRKNDKNSQVKQSYECMLCPKLYYQGKPFTKHLKNDHNIGEKEIEKLFTNKKESEEAFICIYCSKKYTQYGSYKNHLDEHGPDGKLIYKTVCCRKYFASPEEAAAHTESVHIDRVTCFLCQRTYSDPDGLNAHNRYAHNKKEKEKEKHDNQNQKIHQCIKCDRKFANKTTLSDHERSNCGKSPLYKCDVCEKYYHSSGSLKTHRTIHEGTLPHLCQYCGKGFRTQGQVKVHQRKHNGEKPFKCELCSKSFAYRESLLTHVSIHTGKRRFACQNCGLRFSCISNLQAHRKTNSSTCGAKPNNTKAIEAVMGIVGGTVYVGEKNDENE